MVDHNLKVSAIRSRPVSVPRRSAIALGKAAVSSSTLVLVDLETEEGIIGSSYVYCTTPLIQRPVVALLENLSQALKHQSAQPFALSEKVHARLHLAGMHGIIGMAASAIDIAAWDALAKAVGLPLVRLLGGVPRPIQAYNTFGLGLIGPERCAEGASKLLESGLRAIKVRLGYPDLAGDVAVIHAIRRAIGPEIPLMCDYNQSLNVSEAIRRGRRLDEEDLVWIEEPLVSTDYEGHATVAREVRTPIQLGENWWTSLDMRISMRVHASDFAMIDASRIGGVTGWMRAAAMAESQGLPLSSHLIPEVSVHLLGVTPTSHWLEFAEWAFPILRNPLKAASGHATPSDVPGIGLEWDEEAVDRYLVA